MIRKMLFAAAALSAALALLAWGAGSMMLGAWGLSWRTAWRVHDQLHADAASVRDAEGPIPGTKAIAERGFVRIGGIDQWITIRGRDRRNPVILILHGGPGDAISQLAYLFRDWETRFTVVQWDQRGAGRTYGRYGAATPDMTLGRMVEDGAEVADYARRRLGKRRIILVGHSWGSALGVNLLKRRPDLFCAYVGTGQIVRVSDMDQSQYRYTMARLAADHDDHALEQLRSDAPPYRSDAQEEAVRARLDHYLPDADKTYLLTSVDLMLANPRYSVHDFQTLMRGHLDFSLEKMQATFQGLDLTRLGYDMPTPFFVIDGRQDRLTPPGLAAAYVARLRAPAKAMVMIDGGHFAMMSDPDAFLDLLERQVLPAARTFGGC